MVEVAVRKDGSLSGEHGVGIEKRAFMSLMFNETELSAMLDIKHIFDPRNLFNPGKIVPTASTKALHSQGVSLLDEGAINLVPTTTGEAAQTLIACTRAGRKVRISEKTVGNVGATETIVSTAGLRGVKTYAPDDLYIT